MTQILDNNTKIFLINIFVYCILPIFIVFFSYYLFIYLPDRWEIYEIKKNIIEKLLNIKKYYPERFPTNSLKLYLALTNPDVYNLSDRWFNDNIITKWNNINPTDKFELFYVKNNFYEVK